MGLPRAGCPPLGSHVGGGTSREGAAWLLPWAGCPGGARRMAVTEMQALGVAPSRTCQGIALEVFVQAGPWVAPITDMPRHCSGGDQGATRGYCIESSDSRAEVVQGAGLLPLAECPGGPSPHPQRRAAGWTRPGALAFARCPLVVWCVAALGLSRANGGVSALGCSLVPLGGELGMSPGTGCARPIDAHHTHIHTGAHVQVHSCHSNSLIIPLWPRQAW